MGVVQATYSHSTPLKRANDSRSAFWSRELPRCRIANTRFLSAAGWMAIFKAPRSGGDGEEAGEESSQLTARANACNL
jgi:hypothetical protein